MIKAVAGGGGRGMRPAHNADSLIQGFHAARTEAEKAFGNSGVYMEKLIVCPHHIEFQVIGDSHGRIIHLGERDCSIQRRNQKIIEECPSPLIDDDIRKKMGSCSVKLAAAVGYENAGTMEYLVDQDSNFYFMEMNTRIQVEHPVTEEVFGCDLVREQIRVASGEHLSEHVANARPRSHAIECRINAEDPDANFRPSPGRIDLYYAPGGRGVRIDSHVYSGYTVPPHYDSMIAKLICVSSTRTGAIRRMARALSEYLVTGIKTTIPFQARIMENADFLRGDFDTGFVDKMIRMKQLELKG
jgi:acetyl-CoA carboxylase biotin carboxylase subunit